LIHLQPLCFEQTYCYWFIYILILKSLDTKSFLFKESVLRVRSTKGEIKKMTNDWAKKAKADTKKEISDIKNNMAHEKADLNADVEKIKANFGHDAAEKQGAYAKADINADAEKAKADVEKMMEHAKADMKR
jgi:hypothetical protein